MTDDFLSYNVIYIVYDRENENHWSLLITSISLLINVVLSHNLLYSQNRNVIHRLCWSSLEETK